MVLARHMLLVTVPCLFLHLAVSVHARISLSASEKEGSAEQPQEHLLLRPGDSETETLPADEIGVDQVSRELVAFRIRYVAPKAESVYVLWALDNWQIPDKSLWPAGSGEKLQFPYSAMKKDGDAFVISLDLPRGATLDYCFNVLAPSRHVDHWDTNGAPHRDYHSRIVPNGEALIIQPAAAPVRKQSPRSASKPGDWRLPVLISAAGLLVLLSVVVLCSLRRRSMKARSQYHST